MIEAVIFDLGGVVCESPLHVIADHEARTGLEPGSINQVVMDAGADGAWARRERGEIDFEAFRVAFEAECRTAGFELDVADLMGRIDRHAVPRPRMLEAVAAVKHTGRKVAALTNNWVPMDDATFLAGFDVVVESSVEGTRKPQPEIYEITLGRLGVAADHALFLDDIGANLKPARQMGMTTIKVTDVDQALRELWAALGD